MGKKYNFSEDEIKEIVKMYNIGFEGIHTIASKFKVDASVITKRLKDLGVNIPKGSAYSKQYWLDRGLTESKVVEHIKTLRPVNIEYWLKNGYSEEEGVLLIEGQKMVSLRGCIARFGEKEGKIKWNERENKRSEAGKKGSACLQYWLDKGYSEEESKVKRSEKQTTFSKEICIQKYGEEEGLKIFTERQNKWSNTLTSGGNLKIGYSKVSQDLFYKILETYDINERNEIYFATHNKEFRLNKINGGVWLYDFTDIKNKKIIEFHGDMFHGNPKKYKASDYPHPFRKTITAQEMWDKDKLKTDVAIENGYEVMVVWDSEYRWGNKQEIINKGIRFLKNKKDEIFNKENN